MRVTRIREAETPLTRVSDLFPNSQLAKKDLKISRAKNKEINTSLDLVDSNTVSHCFRGVEPKQWELSEKSCRLVGNFQR